MNTQLVPVFDGAISNEPTLLCNARDLHKFLGVKRDFSTWINERVSEYEFIANLDYIEFSPNSGKTGGRRRKDYHLTLDTAKELAMVERNEKGRQVRRYFIECEKRVRNESARERGQEKLLSPRNCRLLQTYDESGKIVSSEVVRDNEKVGSPADIAAYFRKLGYVMVKVEDFKQLVR
ncbi:TPA: antA/AntB antirepressor family protein [Serratia marcescens]